MENYPRGGGVPVASGGPWRPLGLVEKHEAGADRVAMLGLKHRVGLLQRGVLLLQRDVALVQRGEGARVVARRVAVAAALLHRAVLEWGEEHGPWRAGTAS